MTYSRSVEDPSATGTLTMRASTQQGGAVARLVSKSDPMPRRCWRTPPLDATAEART